MQRVDPGGEVVKHSNDRGYYEEKGEKNGVCTLEEGMK